MLQSMEIGETMLLLTSGLVGTPSEQTKMDIDLGRGAQNKFYLLVKLKLYDFTICISCFKI